MSTGAPYEVRFGPEAWTLQYIDELGQCIVTYDCDIDSLDFPPGSQILILNPGVMCSSSGNLGTGRPVDAVREELVAKRVQAFLEGSGFQVRR